MPQEKTTKEKLLKNAEVEWGLKVGPKSNQRQQTQALLNILSKAIDKTREETIREVEGMLMLWVEKQNDESIYDLLDWKEEFKQSLKSLINK